MNEIKNQPEALRLAELIRLSGALPGSVSDAAASELRRLQERLGVSQKSNADWAARTHALEAANAKLRAELDELTAQMAAIGAGGVEPLRKQVAPAAPAATPIAWCVTGCSTMLNEHDAKAEAKRCGGSAKAVPLYTHPQVNHFRDATKMMLPSAQVLEPVEQRRLDIGKAIERACQELPEGAEIQLYLERGAGTVHMTDWDGNDFDHFDEDHDDLACRINAATDGAIAAEQVAAHFKQGEQS